GSVQITNVSNIAMTYDSPTRTAHLTFPSYPNGILPDGNYQGTVLAAQVADSFGNALPANVPFSFFVLSADANHDRSVNTIDFNILAANFSQSNKTFSQGDFNYDGIVNTVDFNLLASNFSKSIAPSAASRAPTTSAGTLPTDESIAEALFNDWLIA